MLLFNNLGNVAKNGWQLSEKKTGNGHTKQPKLPVFFSILNLKYLPIYSNIEVPEERQTIGR